MTHARANLLATTLLAFAAVLLGGLYCIAYAAAYGWP